MRRLLLTAALVVTCGTAGFAGDPIEQAQALFDRALALSQLRIPQFEPYELGFDFRLFQNNGVMTGSYDEVWASPTRWRKDVSISGGFSETIVRSDGKDWVTHNQFSEPVILQELRRSLDRIADLKLHHGEEIAGVHGESVRDTALACVDTRAPGPVNRTFCFDSQNGELQSIQWEAMITEFGGYSQQGPVFFPGTVRVSNAEAVLEGELVKLAHVTVPAASLFAPPQGAQAWLDCDKLTRPKAIYTPDPEYPRGMGNVKYGRVVLRVEVNEKGRPEKIVVENSNDHRFDNAAIQAARQWRFGPATCAGTPVKVTINVEMNFRLF